MESVSPNEVLTCMYTFFVQDLSIPFEYLLVYVPGTVLPQIHLFRH